MKDVKIFKFYTPSLYWEFDGHIKRKENGKSYLKFKDELKNEREYLLPDDLVPLTKMKKIKKSLIISSEESTPTYFMAGDNFLKIDKSHFAINSAFTNEEIVKTGEVTYNLVRAIGDNLKNKGIVSQLGTIILIMIILGIVIGGMWLIWPHISGILGGIHV